MKISVALLGVAAAAAAKAAAQDQHPQARFRLSNQDVAAEPTDIPQAVPRLHSVLGNLSSVVSTPAPTATGVTAATGCARISSAQAKIFASNTSATLTVPASWAQECYETVPLNVSLALEQIEITRKYIQFQTTFAYLADPPEGYLEPPVDVFARLDDMVVALQNGTFANEPEWEAAMYQIWHDTHDGHFYYKMGGINAFAFVSGIELTSVSSDGQELPKIYHAVDILHNNSDASPVTEIDGEDVETYMLALAQEIGFGQDPDANYQFLFTLQGNNAPRKVLTPTFQGYFYSRTLYSGNNFTITFENGTTVTQEWMATVVSNFTGVETGEDFYMSFVRGPALSTSYDMLNPPATLTSTSTANATSTSTTATSSTATAAPTISGYPLPFIMHSAQLVSGYFLEDKPEVAVLSVPSYGPETEDQILEFQSVVQNFLFGAKAANKTKIVVDLSANPGGIILQGYDTFKQFFPQIDPYGGNRMRATNGTNTLGVILSSIAGNATPADDLFATPWNYRHYDNASNDPFKSWPELFGPIENHGDKFTNTIRYPLTDVGFDEYYGGLVVTGYGNRSNFTTQPFPAKDIVMLYDGYCASTCTIFSDMMKSQGQVKAVSVGGRPQTGPMQAIGGTKGANDIEYDYFLEETQLAIDTVTTLEEKKAVAAQLPGILPLYVAQAAVNFRDALRPDSETPLMFVYEASDCRLLYTADMIRNVTALWNTVVEVTWEGKAACINGSTGHPSALPYDLEPVFKEFGDE